MKQKEINEIEGSRHAELGGIYSSSVQGFASDDFVIRMKVLAKHFGGIGSLSKKGGFPESTVKKWVDGTSDPSRKRCTQLAYKTGVSLLWLVDGVGQMWSDKAANEADQQSSQSSVSLKLPKLNTPLKMALEAINKACDEKNARLTTEQMNEIVLLTYDLTDNALPDEKVFSIIQKVIELTLMPKARSLKELVQAL